MKVGIVVVTHGQLATELVNSAEMIVGDLPHFAAVSIGWHQDVDLAREEIGAAIARVGGPRTRANRNDPRYWCLRICSAGPPQIWRSHSSASMWR